MDDKDKTIIINDDHMNFTRIAAPDSMPEAEDCEKNPPDISKSLTGSTILYDTFNACRVRPPFYPLIFFQYIIKVRINLLIL
ncbi:MAG: hypothetical protein ABFR75_02155 [Acidobacteriota bacterium]